MKRQDNCIFCKIVRGDAPAIKVYEDGPTLVFMDINPASEGHTLVISKEHFENILVIDEPAITAVTLTTQRIARAIYRALTPAGMRIAQFNGTPAGQTVFHYHLHLIPVQAGEQPRSHGRGPGDREQIKTLAERIRAALE